MNRPAVPALVAVAAAFLVVARAPADRVALIAALAVAALAVMGLAAVLNRPAIVGLGIGLLVAGYGIAIGGPGAQLDPFAPVVALLLYATFETATARIENSKTRTAPDFASYQVRRILAVGAVGWIAAVLATIAAAVAVKAPGNVVRIAGAVCACLCGVFLAALARRAYTREQPI